MEIVLDRRAIKQIRLSAIDAMQEADTETLREDILEAFSDEQVEEIERRIDSGDFYDLLTELLDEWSGEDADELFELLEAQLSEAGLELKYGNDDFDDDDDGDDDDDNDDSDDDVVDDDDLDLDEDDIEEDDDDEA